MRDILAITDECQSWRPNVNYAAQLAARLEGSLTGLYMPPSLPTPEVGPTVVETEIRESFGEEVQAARHASQNFTRWASSLGVERCDWQVAESSPFATIERAANWNDLLVLERAPEPTLWTASRVGRIVIGSPVPCLVVPQSIAVAKLRTVAVAWNGSHESVRAMHAALPLLRRAGRIVVIHGCRVTPQPAPLWPPAVSLEDYLAWQGLRASVLTIDVPDAQAGPRILFEAGNVSADLLVMGAYGRMQVSERLFGGATLHALQNAQIPLFMRH